MTWEIPNAFLVLFFSSFLFLHRTNCSQNLFSDLSFFKKVPHFAVLTFVTLVHVLAPLFSPVQSSLGCYDPPHQTTLWPPSSLDLDLDWLLQLPSLTHSLTPCWTRRPAVRLCPCPPPSRVTEVSLRCNSSPREKPEHSDTYRASTRAANDASDSQPMAERDGGQGCRVSQRQVQTERHGGGRRLGCALTTLIPTASNYSCGFTDMHQTKTPNWSKLLRWQLRIKRFLKHLWTKCNTSEKAPVMNQVQHVYTASGAG